LIRLHLLVVAAIALHPLAAAAEVGVVRVDVTRPVNSFQPALALGAGVDRLQPKSADVNLQPDQLKQVLSAGWGAVSYRLNTELHVEAWHWNPNGRWSGRGDRGYFVGDAQPGAEPIVHSYGYALPRRGFTRNEGTENEGFSRLNDGDLHTFWKSNPYLERPYTHEDGARFPQWIVIDLGEAKPVDTLRVAWGAPYARRYEVQAWTGEDAIKKPGQGSWRTFPGGVVKAGKGGTTTVKLAPAPVAARFVRVLMTSSSETCASPDLKSDRRNCLGFAVDEVYLGRTAADGTFTDLVQHSADQKQTATYCSSVDPWHEPATSTAASGEQMGLDRFYTSGVTRGLPAMVPVSVLYGVPEDSAAELAYLEKRGYPISYVELGEEADGQYMTPEHYAALYLQWAAALHKVDPKLKLGGPIFEGVNEDVPAWPDAQGNTSWLGRFLAYLKAHGRLADLAFMSFEHYPFDVCKWSWSDLYEEPRRIGHIMEVWRKDGLPPGVPMLVTEVNIAWQAGRRFVEAWGGLWLADYVGAFLTAGGAGTYFFHYLPWGLGDSCDGTAVTFGLHSAGKDFRIKQPLAQYFASVLVAQHWAQPGAGSHDVFAASSDVRDAAGHTLVTAYAVHRPDGQWAVMMVNKDEQQPHDVAVSFSDGHGTRAFVGDLARITFGAEQYAWHPQGDKGKDGYADPDGPPLEGKIAAGGAFTLPRASITVLRGSLGEAAK